MHFVFHFSISYHRYFLTRFAHSLAELVSTFGLFQFSVLNFVYWNVNASFFSATFECATLYKCLNMGICICVYVLKNGVKNELKIHVQNLARKKKRSSPTTITVKNRIILHSAMKWRDRQRPKHRQMFEWRKEANCRGLEEVNVHHLRACHHTENMRARFHIKFYQRVKAKDVNREHLPREKCFAYTIYDSCSIHSQSLSSFELHPVKFFRWFFLLFPILNDYIF